MESLIRLYGVWGQHPHHPVEDWRYEVANSDTRLGYWQWVAIREDGPDPDPRPPRTN